MLLDSFIHYGREMASSGRAPSRSQSLSSTSEGPAVGELGQTLQMQMHMAGEKVRDVWAVLSQMKVRLKAGGCQDVFLPLCVCTHGC